MNRPRVLLLNLSFAAKISPGVSPVDKIMTILTLFENTFFLNNSAAF